ncbi:MAG: chemotaxis protein CheX [Phycisphaeraceae bacterium]
MDSSYITPFVRSTQNVFETMLQLPVQVGEPVIKRAGEPSYDVSGIIGMSGDVEGATVLSFPTATAERVVSLFTGVELAHTHEDFADAVGELVNMISGGAKAQFPDAHVSISCPSVVIGNDHIVVSGKDTRCIVIPCSCDCGDFAVEVSFRQIAASAASNGQTKAQATA